MLTLATSYGWSIWQIEINNVFLSADIQEEVYMQQSPKFVQGDGSLVLVYKLDKALYVLKKAPCAWYGKLHHALLPWDLSASSLTLRYLSSNCYPGVSLCG